MEDRGEDLEQGGEFKGGQGEGFLWGELVIN